MVFTNFHNFLFHLSVSACSVHANHSTSRGKFGFTTFSFIMPMISQSQCLIKLQINFIVKRRFFHSTKHIYNNNLDSTFHTLFSNENKQRVENKLKSFEHGSFKMRRVNLSKNPKDAAVLVTMCIVDGNPGLLYMERSNQMRQHRGEICFPGGMADPSDIDPIQTALRETYEETGLLIDRDQVWGTMQKIPNRKDGTMLVTPVVAFAGKIDLSQLVLDKKEVESVFVSRLADLCNPNMVFYTQFRSGSGYTLPVFKPGPNRIWGLSAIITHMFLKILAPSLYTFKLQHRT